MDALHQRIYALREQIKKETKCPKEPPDYREQLAKFARLYELDKELNSLENRDPVDEEEIRIICDRVRKIEKEIKLVCQGT